MLKQAIRRYFYKMAKVHLCRSNYSNDLEFYRDVTFIKSIIIIHPYTFFVTVLGVDYGYRIGSMPIVFWGVFTYLMLILISLPSRLTIFQRKLFLTIGIYNFGFQLMLDSGMDASGILYWTIGNIMGSLFFKQNNYLLIFALNILMSVIMGMIIYFKSPSPFFSQSLTLADWILIAANNVFLSAIISVLFTELVQSLHTVVINQRMLKEKYEKNVESLKISNHSLVTKNIELEQMAYVISHDLQEPIRMIVSFLGRLIEKYKTQLSKNSKELIFDGISKANKMKGIVNDLLELSLMNIENQTKEVIHLEKLTHQLFIQKDLSVIPIIAIEENNSLYAYEKPVKKIIENLIDNSISFTGSDKKIKVTITCVTKDGFWEIHYQDESFVFDSISDEDFNILNSNHFLEDLGLDFTLSNLLIDQLKGEMWVAKLHHQLIISFKIPI
jgi:signal transduction histidine kinase